MPLDVVRLAEKAAKPWRNGGGLTSELVSGPSCNATPGWRISIAQIDCSGPFSLIPGYDRTLTLISGRATLGVEHETVALTPRKPVQFRGDILTEVRIGRSRALALNVMTDRRLYSHSVEIIQSGGNIQPTESGQANYVVALTGGRIGKAELAPGDLLWRSFPDPLLRSGVIAALIRIVAIA
ncbi:HutD family protein [uncultured Sphingomonas sp.]|uniref:HutD/Ves family protein n=1 Tax=uncultured Sphingomonas sp. TaxID=158754 RepID=UPI0035CC29F9